jgi:hypothetical protein
MYHVRAVSNTASESGAALDDYYAGAKWGDIWRESLKFVDEVVTDTMEKCEIIYTAN